MAKTVDINEFVWTTFYTIDRIIKEWWKNWWDALLLYFKYIELSRMQATNQPWATDTFMMNWLWWGEDKLWKAKKALKDLWLIEIVRRNEEWWKFWKTYIKVNFIINDTDKFKEADLTTTGENHGVVKPLSGKTRTNALSNEVNACSNETNACDLSKDKSANANSEQNHTTESKLVETVQWDEMPIDENELWSAYKCATSRKGKIEDVKKVVKNFSQSEMRSALLELRILTFEFRMGIVDIMRCNTCANAIKNRTNDESLIIDRIENIVNKFKTHKCKTDKIKDERNNEIKTYFKDYLSYTKEKEPTTKEEWIQLYEKYASAWTPYKIKEDYPKCDFAKIKEDWIMRNINWRK